MSKMSVLGMLMNEQELTRLFETVLKISVTRSSAPRKLTEEGKSLDTLRTLSDVSLNKCV